MKIAEVKGSDTNRTAQRSVAGRHSHIVNRKKILNIYAEICSIFCFICPALARSLYLHAEVN